MKITLRGAFFSMALFILFSFLTLYGCGGGSGGGPSSALFSGGRQNISLKLNMLDRTASRTYVSVPQNAVGTVNISVVSVKSKKEAANQTVDYSLGAFTFDDEIPAGDTYSVTVKARLKERVNDIYESIWQGSGTVFVLNADDASKTPGANELLISLSFITIEYIPLYPSKIVFDPVLPIGEIMPSTIIPPFKLSVRDQFGNVMTSENELITVTLENGELKGEANSKRLTDGFALFSGLVVSGLPSGQTGYTKLKAVYGQLTAYSEPIKLSGALPANSAIAGYLTSDSAAAAVSAPRLHAPLSGKEIKAVCDNLQYSALTDSTGFFVLSLTAGSLETPVDIEFTAANGAPVKLRTTIKEQTAKLANIRIGPDGTPRLSASLLSTAYDPGLEYSLLKKAVDNEMALKAATGCASGFSGRVMANGAGLAGALLTIEGVPSSYRADQAGNFTLTTAPGVLTAGDYILTASAPGYITQSQTVSVSDGDYGFIIEPIIFDMAEEPNSPPALAIKSINGLSQNISIVFDLFDAENDPCRIELYYSLDGGSSYRPVSKYGGAAFKYQSGPRFKRSMVFSGRFFKRTKVGQGKTYSLRPPLCGPGR